jgi:hypothetical protein
VHKLQAGVPEEEVKEERMGSLISGETTCLPLQWGYLEGDIPLCLLDERDEVGCPWISIL